ncbi:hypothetical protein Hanom_Chr12g01098971 [Helianthus anomalus]
MRFKVSFFNCFFSTAHYLSVFFYSLFLSSKSQQHSSFYFYFRTFGIVFYS